MGCFPQLQNVAGDGDGGLREQSESDCCSLAENSGESDLFRDASGDQPGLWGT
jgi:hypothetical protein